MRALGLALALLAAPALAQEDPQPAEAPVSPVVVIDRDAVLTGTALGRSILAELDRASAALAAENREIEGQLTAEEEELTRRRPNLPSDEFRALADTFDARVQAIRETQDAKTRELIARRERLGDDFWEEVLPILGEVAAARGALVVLDRGTVFLSSDAVDVTADAISRIDRLRPIGAGEGGGDAPPAPRPAVPSGEAAGEDDAPAEDDALEGADGRD